MSLFGDVWGCTKFMYTKIKEYTIFVYSYIKYGLPFVLVYLIHIIATNLYASLCANLSFIGFVNSLFLIGSPICSMILQIVTHTNTAFIAIISGLCVLIIAYVPRALETNRQQEASRPAAGGMLNGGRTY
jgi:hypothetical protein